MISASITERLSIYRMSTLAEDLERNVHEIIRNLMNNLANLGYEAGFELQTHPPTTTTEAAIKGANCFIY